MNVYQQFSARRELGHTGFVAVSYTHLDVYKRQVWMCKSAFPISQICPSNQRYVAILASTVSQVGSIVCDQLQQQIVESLSSVKK